MEFITNIKEDEYTKFVINNKMGHFLKSYEWGQASKYRGLIPHYVGLKDKNKLKATALILEKKLLLGYSYFYIPRGYTIDYADKDLIKTFTIHIKEYAKKCKAIFFVIDPDIKLRNIDKDAKEIKDNDNNYELVTYLKSIGFKHKKLNYYFENMQPRYTFRVDVTRDIDDIRKSYSKSVNRWIKYANKYQVEVKTGKKEDIDSFVKLMKMTEKRQGFFSHNYDFYYKLYDLFIKNNNIDVLLATINTKKLIEEIDKELNSDITDTKKEKLLKRKELYKELDTKKDIVVSSYINVHYGNKSWYLYGANDLNYKDTYANYKLFDYQICLAHELGKEIFDEFGTIGEPHSTKSVAGLHEFKQKFGGVYTEFIGEFTYVVNPILYFLFKSLIGLYRKPGKLIRHIKVKIQK